MLKVFLSWPLWVNKERFLFKHTLSEIPKSDLNSMQADGEAIEEIIGVTVAVETAMLEELSFSVAETDGEDMDFNSDNVRLTARAQKNMGIVKTYGSFSYEFHDVGEDGYQAALGVVVDISKHTLPGLEAYALVRY